MCGHTCNIAYEQRAAHESPEAKTINKYCVLLLDLSKIAVSLEFRRVAVAQVPYIAAKVEVPSVRPRWGEGNAGREKRRFSIVFYCGLAKSMKKCTIYMAIGDTRCI